MSVKNKVLSCCAAFVVCCGMSYDVKSMNDQQIKTKKSWSLSDTAAWMFIASGKNAYFALGPCLILPACTYIAGIPLKFVVISALPVIMAIPAIYADIINKTKPYHNILSSCAFWLSFIIAAALHGYHGKFTPHVLSDHHHHH